MVQGPIYWVMAEAAQKSGDSLQAAELAKIATILDSTLPERTAKALGTAVPTTRGEKADRFSVALTTLAQGVPPPVAYPPQNGAAVVYPSAPVGDPMMYLPNPGPPQSQQGAAPDAAPVGYAPPPMPVRGGRP